jgi:UDP-N-acetylmuramoyl-tripeptide--D-alanyl-D-alanine ligase
MMQLNSYFNKRYFSWILDNRIRVFHIRELNPLFALIGMFFCNPLIVLVLFAISYFKAFLVRQHNPEKKPLIFTARATRLWLANISLLLLIYILLGITWWQIGNHWLEFSLCILVIYDFLIPILLILTNYIIWPLEKLVQNYYYNDAYSYRITLSDLKVIGITGSFGKTTTKYILNEILRCKFNILKTPGSCNTTMGITEIIRLKLKPIHEIFIAEMSAKQPGDIHEICQLVKPQYGLITAIGEQHLVTFKSLTNIIKTKNELIEALPSSGIAFLNLDDVNCRELASRAKCQVIKYGIDHSDLDFTVKDLILNEHGSNFRIIRNKDASTAVFHTKLLGRHNIYNIVGAIAVASEFGIKLSDMVYPIRRLTAVPHRLELKKIHKDIIFIDDAFSSNPVGSKYALEVLAQISGNRKIIITPGMIELGSKEYEYNRIFGEQIATVVDYVILVGQKQTLALQDGLKSKNYPSSQLLIAASFALAKKHLEAILQPGDVVLFENDLPDNYTE